MGKTKNKYPHKFLGFAAVFIILSFATYAQDRSMPQEPSSVQNPSNAHNSISAQDTFFNSDAAKFANDLVRQTGLSPDKADKIRQILMDYHNNIVETRQDFLRGLRDAGGQNSGSPGLNNNDTNNTNNTNNNSDVTGGQTRNNSDNNAGTNQAGIAQDLLSEYQKADIKADDKIMDVFDNDSQKSKYVQVKRQWWQGVKDRVFSSPNPGSAGPVPR